MKCPHCLVEFHDSPESSVIGDDKDGRWTLVKRLCPACQRFVLQLGYQIWRKRPDGQNVAVRDFSTLTLVRPKTSSRAPVPPEVPSDFSADYSEACLVLADSAKASAALSRRCLQHVLREKAGVKKSDLADEIQQVIDSGKLPTHLSESLDAIRNIGNFAAHPIKSKISGELVDVEPGEAEWNLDVLELLFDFYFVQPETIRRKRAALNLKLGDAGKPPMK
jgi:hypothetical protein